MLITAELFFHLLSPGRYIGNWRVPTLQETEMGWILAGRAVIQRSSNKIFNVGRRQFRCTATMFLGN